MCESKARRGLQRNVSIVMQESFGRPSVRTGAHDLHGTRLVRHLLRHPCCARKSFIRRKKLIDTAISWG